ncbi:MAG: cobalamin-dependent protein [Sandaracinaceae bacterium]|nr:cobalamin-dependent protein [Sandaracinaceae bacterium]
MDAARDCQRSPSEPALDALVIVPPFVKSSGGPPLGPAMLRGAALRAGFRVEVLDLAIEATTSIVPADELRRGIGLAGDHDKNEGALRDAQRRFFEPVARATGLSVTDLTCCRLSWAELDRAVEALAAAPWAVDLHARFEALAAPRVVGVSVMFSDQVLAGLVAARAARRMWPSVPIVWGGAHVTALAPELAADARYGRGIDGFVAGYAEQTFVELLAAVRDGRPWPAEAFVAGSGAWQRARGAIETTPSFPTLSAYGAPRLTLPVQVTRGCAYGLCGFCTYPFVEGASVEPRTLDHVEQVVALAAELRAVVSFKDALMTGPYLRRMAALIGGRARWSACSKVTPALVELLPALAASGCETLEVGIETLVERSQLVIEKKVTRRLVDALLRAARAAGVGIVVNYMTGLPLESPRDAADCYRWIKALAAETGAVVEHHEFEAERRAKLVTQLRVTATWPWSSVVAWERMVATEAA